METSGGEEDGKSKDMAGGGLCGHSRGKVEDVEMFSYIIWQSSRFRND